MKRLMDKMLLVFFICFSQIAFTQNILTERIEYDFWLTELDSLDDFMPSQKQTVKPKYEKWVATILKDVQSGKMKAYSWEGNSYKVNYIPFSKNKIDSLLLYPYTQTIEIRPIIDDTCYAYDFSGKQQYIIPCDSNNEVTQIVKLQAYDFGKIRFREKWEYDSMGQLFKYVEAIEFWAWKHFSFGGVEISAYQPVFSIKPNENLDLNVFDTVSLFVKIINDYNSPLTWYEHNIFPPNRTDWIFQVYSNLNNKKLVAYTKNSKGIYEPTCQINSYLVHIDTLYSGDDGEAFNTTYSSIEPENIEAITFKEIWKYDANKGMQKIVLAYAPTRIQRETINILVEEINNKVGDYEIENSYEEYLYKYRPLFWLFFK